MVIPFVSCFYLSFKGLFAEACNVERRGTGGFRVTGSLRLEYVLMLFRPR